MGIEAEILAVVAARHAALVANVAADVAASMTDDWVYVGPTGITSKSDLIGSIATGQLQHHTMRTIGSARVAAYGDTVLVTARVASTGSWAGTAYAADEWISDVYVRRNGRWLCALSQKSVAEDGGPPS
jgi:ketosteroid isomerase-like protein